MFVTDADLRDVLARDIGAVDRALANGEWKAATVLAGSLVEALLLWKVGQPEYAEKVGATLVASKLRELAEKRGGSALEHGGLGDYLVLVKEVNIALRDETLTACGLAQNFRNLVHPGRAQRLGQMCDRSTALTAVAALEHLIRDFSGAQPDGRCARV